MVKLPNLLGGSQDQINKRFLKWIRELRAEIDTLIDEADSHVGKDEFDALEVRVKALEDAS